jgi:cell wall-associated NlpC family hydrolase
MRPHRLRMAAALALVAITAAGCSLARASTPGGGGGVGTASCSGGTVAGAKPEQIANARAIASVATGLGLGTHGILIGVLTADVEADLINVGFGDHNSDGSMTSSRGLFQQIAAWGPEADRMDPTKSATMFYTGGQAGQKGLIQVPGWETMDPGAAMQAVQGSQFAGGTSPDYAGKLAFAQTITDAIGPGCTMNGAGGTAAAAPPGSPLGPAIVAAANTQMGMPYVWGGGGPTGASGIDSTDGRGPGFDCSGLVQYAVYTASGGRITLPRTAAEQASTAGVAVPSDLSQMQPGDLVGFADPGQGAHHIGIYVGNGQMINAPESTKNVQINTIATGFYADTSTWQVRRVT